MVYVEKIYKSTSTRQRAQLDYKRDTANMIDPWKNKTRCRSWNYRNLGKWFTSLGREIEKLELFEDFFKTSFECAHTERRNKK